MTVNSGATKSALPMLRTTAILGWSRLCRIDLFGLALLLYPLRSAALQPEAVVLLVPFEDHSYFRGSWDLSRGIPQVLGELLQQDRNMVVLPLVDSLLTEGEDITALSEAQALRIGDNAGADLVVNGDIRNFSIKRFNAGNPFLGGYTSYTALVEVEIQLLQPLSMSQVGAAAGKAEMTDRGLGLTLLGKPTRKEAALLELNEVPFGVERFRQTIIGKATLAALQQLTKEIGAKTSPPHTLQQREPKILSLKGTEGFVNLGLADKIEVGHKFVVYSRRDMKRIGIVQIVEVLAQHLSRILVLEGQEHIQVEDALAAP